MSETSNPNAIKGTVVVFPGSWETIVRPENDSPDGMLSYDNWSPFRRKMQGLGYSALILESLPSQDPDASPQDYFDAAIAEIDERADSPVVVMAGYSAGGALVEPTMEEMERRGRDTSDMVVEYITASLPKPDAAALAANPLLADLPLDRSTEDFRDSVRVGMDRLTSMDRKDAQRLIFERAGWLAGKLAVMNMRRTVRLDSSLLSLPGRLTHRTAYLYDPEEMIRLREHVEALARAYAADGFTVVEIPNAGHAIHVSKPGALAEAMIRFAEESPDQTPTVRLPRFDVPRQREGDMQRSAKWFE